MNFIKTASFGTIFGTAFIVTATAQLAFGLLGIVLAILAPGMFHMNGAPATSPVGAIGVLVFLLVVGLIMNATVNVCGAAILMGVRRFLPAKA